MDQNRTNYPPWEKNFDQVISPLEEFIHDEITSGLILMACILLALFLANDFLNEHYQQLLAKSGSDAS